MTKASLGLALTSAVLLCTACSPSADAAAAEPSLDAIRSAVEKYQDINVAIADGYVRDALDLCELPSHHGLPAELGAMGLHYVRPDLLGIDSTQTRLDVNGTHTDFLQPAILIYEPQADGGLELVAVENIVLASAWDAANRRAPSFQGRPFDFNPDDEDRVIRAHYDKHVWLFRDNPSGMYAEYNPNVTCDHHEIVMPMWHPGMDSTMQGGGVTPSMPGHMMDSTMQHQ